MASNCTHLCVISDLLLRFSALCKLIHLNSLRFFLCSFLVFQVPESPSWLLSQYRLNDAEKALQWLRGWVSKESIQKELLELQNYCNESTACLACAKKSIKCGHPNATLCDKIKELKRKRTLKPIFLVFLLYFFFETCIITVLQPYIILVLKAYGMQIDANKVTVLIAVTSMLSSIFLITTVTKLGRRPLYLTSSLMVVLCSIALSKFKRGIGNWHSTQF